MKQLFFILLLDIIIFTKQTTYDIYPNNTEINSLFQTSIAGDVFIFHEGEGQYNANIQIVKTFNKMTTIRGVNGENLPGTMKFQIINSTNIRLQILNCPIEIGIKNSVNIALIQLTLTHFESRDSRNIDMQNTIITNEDKELMRVDIFNCQNMNLINNTIYENNYYGLYLQYCKNCYINNNTIYHSTLHNIKIDDCHNCTINANYLLNNLSDNIKLGNGTIFYLNTISNNVMISSKNSIIMEKEDIGNYTNFKNNKIFNNIMISTENNINIIDSFIPIVERGEIKNNLFIGTKFFINENEFSSWVINNNFFRGINSGEMPENTNSKIFSNKEISYEEIFFYKEDVCDYSKLFEDKLNINCFKPMEDTDNDMTLYHNGIPTSLKRDILNINKSAKNPSVGVFEYGFRNFTLYVEYCLHLDDMTVGVLIHTSNYRYTLIDLIKIDKCLWGGEITQYNDLEYKIVLKKGNSIKRWFTTTNRIFNLTKIEQDFKSMKSSDYKYNINSEGETFKANVYIEYYGYLVKTQRVEDNSSDL